MFVQFVAQGYLCHLQKKLKAVRCELWNQSIAQIMDWFDCIETTTCQTLAGTVRWSTELVAQDRLLLEKLSVTKE